MILNRLYARFLVVFVSLRIYIHFLVYPNSQYGPVATSRTFTKTLKAAVTNSTTDKVSQFATCNNNIAAPTALTWWSASYPDNTTTHFYNNDEMPTVIYPSYPQIPWPCFSAETGWEIEPVPDWHPSHTTPTNRGLVFIKLLKVASTTAAGIHLRIAERERHRRQSIKSTTTNVEERSSFNNDNNKRRPRPTNIFMPARLVSDSPTNDLCLMRFRHGMASSVVNSRAWPHAWAHPSSRHPSLESPRLQRARHLRVWTMVREPTVRAMSEFFYVYMVRHGWEPTAERIIEFLQGQHSGATRQPYSHYRTWLSTTSAGAIATLEEWNNHGPEFIHQILSDFDFVGVTERFDESLVVWSFLWQIPLGDLLYLSSSKSSGTWTMAPQRDEQACHMLTEPPLSILQSPSVQAYLQSSEWRDRVYWDQRIYQAAVVSLDATISFIGAGRVQKRLTEFRAAQAVAAQACPPDVYQICYPNGTMVQPRDRSSQCYLLDIGCGHACLDQVAEDLGIDEYHE
jgi:hypothetical protein